MNYLASISSSDARMKLIEDERHSGSMPMELFLRLKKYVQVVDSSYIRVKLMM